MTKGWDYADELKPAWGEFLACGKCGTEEGEPCWDLRKKGQHVENTNPHHGRKLKPRNA